MFMIINVKPCTLIANSVKLRRVFGLDFNLLSAFYLNIIHGCTNNFS